jgi:hypothetical protein
MPQLFSFGSYEDASRILVGQTDASAVDAMNRYGMSGGGDRLVAVGDSDGDVPEIASDGFLWCGVGTVNEKSSAKDLDIPGHMKWSDNDSHVIRVTPKFANGIWVADHGAYERRRSELLATRGDRKQLTDADVRDFVSARGRTITPITDYAGGFELPVVLINRDLALDEVEVVNGPAMNEQRRGLPKPRPRAVPGVAGD